MPWSKTANIKGPAGSALIAQPTPRIVTPANPVAVETIVAQVAIPAGVAVAGMTFRYTAAGIISATSPTLTARLRVGASGTIADAAVVATPAVAVATTTGWTAEMFFTVRTLGSTGTWMGQGYILGTAPGKSINVATPAINTTVAQFVSFSLQAGGTAPNLTVVTSFVDIL